MSPQNLRMSYARFPAPGLEFSQLHGHFNSDVLQFAVIISAHHCPAFSLIQFCQSHPFPGNQHLSVEKKFVTLERHILTKQAELNE